MTQYLTPTNILVYILCGVLCRRVLYCLRNKQESRNQFILNTLLSTVWPIVWIWLWTQIGHYIPKNEK